MPAGILKNLIEGGLKGLGETAKGIIQQVGENKLGVSEAALAIEKEANRASEAITAQANDLEKAYLLDIQDSRNANVKVQESDKASWLAKNVGYMLDIFVILIWACMTFYIAAKYLNLISSAPGVDFSGIWGLYATVTSMATIVLSWHRGSSKGSEDKSKVIDRMSKH